MTDIESRQFRDSLAKHIKETSKEDREDVLNNAKTSSEYWQARNEKIHTRQDEEVIDGGFGVFVKSKTLYHGSNVRGIEKFDRAIDDTVGSGVYFTSQAKDAIGYARVRSKQPKAENSADTIQPTKESQPTIYEVLVENMSLCDLRRDENVQKVLEGFKEIIKQELRKPDLRWYVLGGLEKTMEAINSGKVNAGNLKIIAQTNGKLFSDYVQSLGYKGLIALEGGEGGNDNHDTYLIFDPGNVRIAQEHEVL